MTWTITPEEPASEVHAEASLVRWVHCGRRDDYALVSFHPVLGPGDWALTTTVHEAVLAPRHAGFDLRTGPFPLSAYLATTAEPIGADGVVAPEELTIRIWVNVTP